MWHALRQEMQLFFLGAVILSSYRVLCEPILINNPLITALEWPYVKGQFPYDVQSPTDIITSRAIPKILRRITIHLLWNMPDEAVNIENNGYYLEVHLREDLTERPWVQGGPLIEDIFLLEQMHIHWGPNDECGSENYMDGECFSCEVHVVLFNKKYGSFDEAKYYPDGLSVIAFFGEASDEDNPDFDDLVNKIAEVIEPETKTTGSFHEEFRFLEILFQQTTYYSIPGSLTTDPYLESVTWIFYFVPFNISHQQLAAFRKLKSKDGTHLITNNDRPLQPFGPRPLITPIFDTEPDCQN